MTGRARLLFVTLSNIGDLVMTTPLLQALHAEYPAHVIDIVADARSSQLLRACPYRGRLLHRDKQAGLRGTVSLIKTLRRTHYDIAVDLRTAFLSYALHCGQRAVKQRKPAPGAHAVEHHFTALNNVVSHTEIPAACLWLDEPAKHQAAVLLGETADERRLVIAPGANWPGKIWPVEYYADAIDALANDFDRVVVIGSTADRVLGQKLVSKQPLPVVNLAGETDLLGAAACMVDARAFIGNDSGIGHMAAALRVPTVTVFGPGEPGRYRPWGRHVEVVLSPNEDLGALHAQTVVDAVRRLVAKAADEP